MFYISFYVCSCESSSTFYIVAESSFGNAIIFGILAFPLLSSIIVQKVFTVKASLSRFSMGKDC